MILCGDTAYRDRRLGVRGVCLDWQERSRLLVGDEKINRLGRSHVILFGLGGVGSFVAEALARSGIGALSLVDCDVVAGSNRNRQLPALCSTTGRLKTEVVADRLRDINPDIRLYLYPIRISGDNLDAVLDGDGGRPDFIADAIDDLPAKVSLILAARARDIPSISSMGAGFRLDPTQLAIGDISETHTCPLARKLRRNLREAGVSSGVPVVWSKETPKTANIDGPQFVDGSSPDAGGSADGMSRAKSSERTGPASMIFVPAAAGLLMASHIVNKI